MKWAMVERLKEYLRGQQCIVWNDNKPLIHLESAKLGYGTVEGYQRSTTVSGIIEAQHEY